MQFEHALGDIYISYFPEKSFFWITSTIPERRGQQARSPGMWNKLCNQVSGFEDFKNKIQESPVTTSKTIIDPMTLYWINVLSKGQVKAEIPAVE